ncbi:hypothetical protein GTW43_32630 [Streptomyces sp. SID5785]|uniref:hypothetical protein n=1 Tax=Streptomyces sp. SID5785 TaxID=2690309 RepID=UPI001360F974|nr:hypothetical protein [Streptomyces sp. SID5785]MZD09793.1 hypothetical protein [Streptomyces sp. SID5785]
MIDVVVLLSGVVGVALLAEAVWAMRRSVQEGGDTSAVVAKGVSIALAASLCGALGLAAVLIFTVAH